MEKDLISFMYEYQIQIKEPKPKLKIGRPKKPKVNLNYKIYKPPKEGKTKLEMKRENIRTRLIETQMKADLFRESLQSAK